LIWQLKNITGFILQQSTQSRIWIGAELKSSRTNTEGAEHRWQQQSRMEKEFSGEKWSQEQQVMVGRSAVGTPILFGGETQENEQSSSPATSLDREQEEPKTTRVEGKINYQTETLGTNKIQPLLLTKCR
jgi:hypothetical protein